MIENVLNNKITLLIDYKGVFGSKYNSIPYRSGMNKEELKNQFLKKGFEAEWIPMSDIYNYEINYWKGRIIIYTSSEDVGYAYKSYIEDIILFLEINNALVIPSFKFLRANNNKVFMELLQKSMNISHLNKLKTGVFGCIEESYNFIEQSAFPLVFKLSSGAMSKGVGIGYTHNDLLRKLKKQISKSNRIELIKEVYRSKKYPGYTMESKYRDKFILQEYVEDLNGDFKVLIFSNKYFVLKRGIKSGDFRASGSGIRHYIKDIPEGLLNYSHAIFQNLKVPNASLDIAFNGKSFFLLEFQCIYFGSYTLTFSEFYWQYLNNQFEFVTAKSNLEVEYVNSIVDYLRNL